MGKSEEMLRMERDMNEQPELREKLEAECKRIAEAGEAQNDGEIMVKAAAALGYTVTLEELERSLAEAEKLDDDELDDVAGGGTIGQEDEKGHDAWCMTAWHCFAATLHTEAKTKYIACLKDYNCHLAYQHEIFGVNRPNCPFVSASKKSK